MSSTKQIQMLIEQIRQQNLGNKQDKNKELVDRQYEMLRAGNRASMLRTLSNNKFNSDTHTNIDGKTSSYNPSIKQDFMRIKNKNDFKDKATEKYNEDLKQRKIDCDRGALTACAYVSKRKETIDSIANQLADEHNKKAKEFNDKLKSQTQKNPLTTTSDVIVDSETGRIVNNPVVINLQNQEKLKELMEQRTSSDAFKLGQQMKEREQNIINIGNPNVVSDKPTGLIKYGQFELKQEKINELEQLRKSNPTAYYQELQKMASKPKSNLTPIQQRSYKDIQRELENMPNPFLLLVSKKDQKKITIATM
jgi:hypothetical protein